MDAAQAGRLSAELKLYADRKSDWLRQQPGKYVVIRQDTILGFHSTFQDAYQAGVGAWGINTDFLVKQVVENEPVFFVF